MAPRLLRTRTLLFGLVAGVVLSAARAPLGGRVEFFPAANPFETSLFRAAALFLLVLCCGRFAGLFAARLPVALLATGAAAGFALHGLVLKPWMELEHEVGLILLLTLAGLALVAIAHTPRAAADAPRAPSWLERAGLFVAGGGAALGLESIARTLRLLGGGTYNDDSVFGAVLLVELALACAAFGGVLAKPARARAGLAAGLALGTAVCLYSTWLLYGLSDRDGLDDFLRSPPWSLDFSHWSRIGADLVISARVFVAPAFVLGTALAGARHRAQLASVLAGAATAILCLGGFVSLTAARVDDVADLPALRTSLAASLAGVGAIVALLASREAGERPPFVALGVAAAAAVVVWVLPHRPALPLSPWEKIPPQPSFLRDTPEGLLTIEQSFVQSPLVTLDRRRLTPESNEEAADEQRFELAFSLVDPEKRAKREVRLHLIGQLTPARAFTLERLGAGTIDRTAAWADSMEEIEAQLFAGSTIPSGQRGYFETESGAFDLVIVPPVRGDAPAPKRDVWNFTQVVWLDASTFVAHRNWGARVLLSSNGFEDLCIGVSFDPRAPFMAGKPLREPMPWRWLSMTPFERVRAARAAAAHRLALAAEKSREWKLMHGLELHYAAQVTSSPWETHAQQTELDVAALDLLRDYALESAELDPFTRDLWSAIAKLLVEKRELELIQSYLAPLAERHAPWTELERALARADLELLDPASAAERLLKVIEREPYDIDLRLTCAEALLMSDRAADAVVQLQAALALQPSRIDVKRRLAMARVRAGDPEGGAMVRELLLENPDDEELRAYLGVGPLPPVQPSFVPSGDRH